MSPAGPLPALGAKALFGVAVAGLGVGAVLGFTLLGGGSGGGPDIVAEPAAIRALDCPDGEAVTTLEPGDRVYAIGRDDAGDWRAIRDPRDTRRVVWVRTALVEQDADRDLPVVPCPIEGVFTMVPVTTTTVPAPDPTTTSVASTTTVATTTTTAPADTTDPEFAGAIVTSYTLWTAPPNSGCPTTTSIIVGVLDDGGVVSVTGAYEDLPGSPLEFTNDAGNLWQTEFGPFVDLPSTYSQEITITVVAEDAAGNMASTPIVITVNGYSCVR